MITEIKLPELGENIESAEIVSVLVKTGDTIEKDQSVLEIETDKATVEVPSNVSGKVTEVLVKESDSVKVGQIIIKVEDGGEAEAETKAESEETNEETKSEVKKRLNHQAQYMITKRTQPQRRKKKLKFSPKN